MSALWWYGWRAKREPRRVEIARAGYRQLLNPGMRMDAGVDVSCRGRCNRSD